MIWLSKEKTELPDITLDGCRVYLRPPHIRDWEEWIAMRERNREILIPLEPKWPDKALDKEFFMRRLSRQLRDWSHDRGYPFLLYLRDTDALIGGVNLNNVCRGAAQFASIGYWLDEKHQGMGYMSEGIRLIIYYAFGALKLHRINAGCLPHNERSIKVLTRLGFVEEGFAKSYLEINGRWQDHILFGLTAEDWKEKQKTNLEHPDHESASGHSVSFK